MIAKCVGCGIHQWFMQHQNLILFIMYIFNFSMGHDGERVEIKNHKYYCSCRSTE